MAQRGHKLVFELVARAAGAGPLGTSALHHEIGDHAVKFEPVVIAAPDQIDEVGDGDRRFIGHQVHPDGAFGRIENRL